MIIDFSKYYSPKPKQAMAHACKAKYILFGGALGGGKSWWLCGEAIRQIMLFNGNRVIIVRKELSVLKRTTLITFFAICPPGIIASFNQTTMEVHFINGSVLTFLGANFAKDPLLNRIKGMELGAFFIDEANEISREVYQMLKTRLRWVLPDGTLPNYIGRLTSNPEAGWLIPTFIQSTNPDEVYIQSLTSDNYEEGSDYIQTLKEAFKDTPNLLRKYLYGDWRQTDAINQLISNEALEKAIHKIENGFGTSLGVDIARFGNDASVYTVIKDGNIDRIESYGQTSIVEVTTRTIQLMNEYNIDSEYVGIDSVGVGGGVVDNLWAAGYNVIAISGGEKPDESVEESNFKLFNKRSQVYNELKKDIEAGNIGNLYHEGLRLELQSQRYEIFSDKTLRVVSKEAIKKLLGKSPDFADSLAYANYVRTYRGGYNGYVPMYGG